FAGNQRKVLVQNAEINLLTSRHQQNEVLLELERDLSNAYYTFQSTLRQLDLDQKSLESAQENFDRTNDAFKLGQANSVQFREAQLNLLRVRNRINDLRFTAKLNEIEILRLSGQLIGEK
ncbi:MAG: TolC family protein, partial [Bacteroidetes bacterium]|nr:TolC family protein [Bacteroidota bacterium]